MNVSISAFTDTFLRIVHYAPTYDDDNMFDSIRIDTIDLTGNLGSMHNFIVSGGFDKIKNDSASKTTTYIRLMPDSGLIYEFYFAYCLGVIASPVNYHGILIYLPDRKEFVLWEYDYDNLNNRKLFNKVSLLDNNLKPVSFLQVHKDIVYLGVIISPWYYLELGNVEPNRWNVNTNKLSEIDCFNGINPQDIFYRIALPHRMTIAHRDCSDPSSDILNWYSTSMSISLQEIITW